MFVSAPTSLCLQYIVTKTNVQINNVCVLKKCEFRIQKAFFTEVTGYLARNSNPKERIHGVTCGTPVDGLNRKYVQTRISAAVRK